MKDLGEVTVMKEWIKSLGETRILEATDLKELVTEIRPFEQKVLV